ncbi:MAG TPA: Rrf2 family transcriptional regulator [Vicinamibacterales bacterium]|nr:Rrf2 family transcriptional regulator [Vicinamibacterales bacterium]
MQITRTADYGVRMMIALATHAGDRLTVAELARESGASQAFAGKVLQRLANAHLVASRRGYEGGFVLARPAGAISLLEIVNALDGPLCVNVCVPGGTGCDRSESCGAVSVWARAQSALAGVLDAQKLDGLVPEEMRG